MQKFAQLSDSGDLLALDALFATGPRFRFVSTSTRGVIYERGPALESLHEQSVGQHIGTPTVNEFLQEAVAGGIGAGSFKYRSRGMIKFQVACPELLLAAVDWVS